jgi:hypothetical protein
VIRLTGGERLTTFNINIESSWPLYFYTNYKRWRYNWRSHRSQFNESASLGRSCACAAMSKVSRYRVEDTFRVHFSLFYDGTRGAQPDTICKLHLDLVIDELDTSQWRVARSTTRLAARLNLLSTNKHKVGDFGSVWAVPIGPFLGPRKTADPGNNCPLQRLIELRSSARVIGKLASNSLILRRLGNAGRDLH